MERCIKVLTTEDLAWNDYIGQLPIYMQDIYFTRQYHLLEEKRSDGKAYLFVYAEMGTEMGLYAFIKRPIEQMNMPETFFDIETVYGYGGPLVNTENDEFVRRFEEAFLEYCRDENIIAEFVRFHPLIQNQTIFKEDIQVLHNRKTVALDLSSNIDDIWMQQISTQNRNTIRKCIKNNLTVEETDDYEAFMHIYDETMRRVNADEFYSFEQTYFDELRRDDKNILLCVKYNQKMIAAAIFMGYGEYFHYHLSGSRREYLKLAPNNILLWEAIKYAKEHGYQKMHFGGGLSDSMEDNLFKFKSHFSKEYVDFYIGKRVHNNEIYNMLIHQWEMQSGKKASLLLQYRTTN